MCVSVCACECACECEYECVSNADLSGAVNVVDEQSYRRLLSPLAHGLGDDGGALRAVRASECGGDVQHHQEARHLLGLSVGVM